MILQLGSFDYLTASASRLVSVGGILSSLPRLASHAPLARLLIVADTLGREEVAEGFRSVATPEDRLPPGAVAYRMAYEDFLTHAVQEVRYTRTYFVMDPVLDDGAMIGLMGAYGIEAGPLDHELPRPFESAVAQWDCLQSQDGRYLTVLRTRFNQFGGVLHPRVLHNLLALEFPLWIALQFYTFPQRDTTSLFRMKNAMVRFGEKKTVEAVEEAHTAQIGLTELRDAVTRGEALHAVNLYVVVDGKDPRELSSRAEIVRGSVGLQMERQYGSGDLIARLFSADLDQARPSDGFPMSTSGAAILAGSALSYRRRTQMRGVMLGIDRNQSPVVLDVFDDRNPSYNTVILGQTGSGKTFATLLLMMRHLMTGVRLVMIDPQSNIKLDFLGPEVYQRSEIGTNKASVNVLDIVHDEIGSQVEMALSMLGLLDVHSGKPLERALLDEALMALYAPVWGTQKIPPTLGDLRDWMERRGGHSQSPIVREATEILSLVLRTYVVGSRADRFGKQTTVDFRLDHAVNVFDVANLPMDKGDSAKLRSALLSILVANINLGIRRRRKAGDVAPIMFFVDEMGVMMRDAVIAEYISAEYKTARARLVGMIVADQDLHSLLGPKAENGLHHGIPILANAANTLIFQQKDTERAAIREHFPALPEPLVDALPILQRGTCIATFPDDLLVVSVLPSQFERIVFSSRLQDREDARKIVEQLRSEISGAYKYAEER
jgi:hypothetical protein